MLKNLPQASNNLLISESYKVVYVSIPKVASSSIKKYMWDNLKSEEMSPNKRTHGLLWYESFHDYFTFSFVRNPLERLLSCYKNKIKFPNIINEDIGVDRIFTKYGTKFYKEMSYKDFLKTIIALDPTTYDYHFSPQYRFICDESDNITVDFVGRFENFKSDFEHIISSKKLPVVPIPHLNRVTYDEQYDEEAIELAKNVYGVKKDMEIFNYE